MALDMAEAIPGVDFVMQYYHQFMEAAVDFSNRMFFSFTWRCTRGTQR